jgi:hypothetical protein
MSEMDGKKSDTEMRPADHVGRMSFHFISHTPSDFLERIDFIGLATDDFRPVQREG